MVQKEKDFEVLNERFAQRYKEIENLTKQDQELKSKLSDKDKETEMLKSILVKKDQEIKVLNSNLASKKQEIKILKSYLDQKNTELSKTGQKMKCSNENDQKIKNLNLSLVKKCRELAESLMMNEKILDKLDQMQKKFANFEAKTKSIQSDIKVIMHNLVIKLSYPN